MFLENVFNVHIIYTVTMMMKHGMRWDKRSVWCSILSSYTVIQLVVTQLVMLYLLITPRRKIRFKAVLLRINCSGYRQAQACQKVLDQDLFPLPDKFSITSLIARQSDIPTPASNPLIQEMQGYLPLTCTSRH